MIDLWIVCNWAVATLSQVVGLKDPGSLRSWRGLSSCRLVDDRLPSLRAGALLPSSSSHFGPREL